METTKKTTYTYDDVMRKAAEFGLLKTMSEGDRMLTQKNPDAGMTVLLSRDDYRKATSADAKALAHYRAEQARKQYGGYSGGTDGSGYYLNPISPADYESDDAPSFSDRYGDAIAAEAAAIKDRPGYTSPYGDDMDDLLKAIGDTANYRYDPDNDDLFDVYAKIYRREGQRALNDTLGQAAALTGGIPSSAAVTAAGQARNYYATQLADKIPELLQTGYDRQADRQKLLLNALNANRAADSDAYQRYRNDIGLDMDRLEMLRTLRNDDYVRYRDALARYNTDRDFGYNQFVSDISYDNALESADRAQRNYENELRQSQSRYDAEYRQALADKERERRWNAALYAFEYLGDATPLKQLIAAERR